MNRSDEHKTLASTSANASARVEAQKQWKYEDLSLPPMLVYSLNGG